MSPPPPTDTRVELFRALGVLAEPPGPGHARVAGPLGLPEPDRAEWTEAFVVQLVPYASVYLGPDGMLGGEAADRVAGFWRALRLPVPPDADHLTALLGLYATLRDSEHSEPDTARRRLWRQARTALLHEHLVSWLLPYAHAMTDVAPAGYATWAGLVRQALLAEIEDVGVPDRLPAALREIPALDADEVLDGILVPARSGVLLTRGHLGVLARRRGLGMRLGDRRRMLRSLVEQDPEGTLAALAGHARTWQARHRADEPVAGAVAAYWADRAAATAGLLDAAQELSEPSRSGATPVREENRT